jgi:hypothetical protein
MSSASDFSRASVYRRRVAVDGPEVALPVHERVAHVEFLRHADERVVDRGVAVGMEVAHHLADDLGALAIPARRRQPHVLHAVQHAAVRRLEAITDVRQRSPDDYAHRVIHVRALHLVFDVDGNSIWIQCIHRGETCRPKAQGLRNKG